jgi:hypothetical protein
MIAVIARIMRPDGRRILRTSAGFPATLFEPAAHRIRDAVEAVRREVETPF